MILFFLGEEFGIHGSRWHIPQDKQRPAECDGTHNQEEILPDGKFSVDVSNRPGQEAVNDGTGGGEDQSVAGWLL